MTEAAEGGQKFQRRTVLVKRSLQIKYVATVFVSALLVSAIVGADVYYSMAKIILRENPSLLPMVAQPFGVLALKVLIFLAIVLGISLYVSHRFAGPIYRFEKSAQIAASGDLTHRVSLRTGDELLELQEEFNGMLASLQAMIQKDRSLAARAVERLEATLVKLSGDASARAELESIKKELERFTQSFKV